MIKKYVCVPRSFLVINVCNQGKNLCSPCTSLSADTRVATVMTEHLRRNGNSLESLCGTNPLSRRSDFILLKQRMVAREGWRETDFRWYLVIHLILPLLAYYAWPETSFVTVTREKREKCTAQPVRAARRSIEGNGRGEAVTSRRYGNCLTASKQGVCTAQPVRAATRLQA